MTKGVAQDRARGRPRDSDADEAILRAAVELFIENGAEAVNFERIAKLTGITRATIYRRWKSRDELLITAIRHTKGPGRDSPEAFANMSPSELLHFLRDAFVAALTRPELPRLVARLIGLLPDHSEVLTIYRDEFVEPRWQAISNVLEKARRTGALPRLPDKELLRELLSGAITYRLLMREGIPQQKAERKWVDKLMDQLGMRLEKL
ncbi:TetR/AcrR family transcriptional regulator [Bradyrhizobium sp. 26S5]|jgi:AcrR family transcriptional regulator|uniref:TetR/AcrR family transcriptional regulator n=1 Tax=Bradyrhizobium sp. 26S5 TaxID=3139729 RepID=UPI0030D201D1